MTGFGGLSPVDVATLTAASFLTAAMTAAVGVGGGVLMLAVMAFVLPAPAIIPVHGIVQLASNLGRAGVLGRFARWTTVLWFCVGGVIGVAFGGQIAVGLSANALELLLAGFILVSIWGPMPRFERAGAAAFAVGGAIASFLTMFVGATGPFVMAILAPDEPERRRLVATHAVTMTLQHALKVVTFGVLGFAFGPYAALLVMMVGFGFLGTLAGTKILTRTSNAQFRRVFRVSMTLIAIALVGQVALSAR